MSGNSIAAAVYTGQGDWASAGHRAFPIPVFVLGVMLGAALCEWLARRKVRPILAAAFGLEAVLLALFVSGWPGGTSSPAAFPHDPAWQFYAVAALPALAMGVQNAALRRVGAVRVRTTYITGMLTNAAEEAVTCLFGLAGRSGDEMRLLSAGACSSPASGSATCSGPSSASGPRRGWGRRSSPSRPRVSSPSRCGTWSGRWNCRAGRTGKYDPPAHRRGRRRQCTEPPADGHLNCSIGSYCATVSEPAADEFRKRLPAGSFRPRPPRPGGRAGVAGGQRPGRVRGRHRPRRRHPPLSRLADRRLSAPPRAVDVAQPRLGDGLPAGRVGVSPGHRRALRPAAARRRAAAVSRSSVCRFGGTTSGPP